MFHRVERLEFMHGNALFIESTQGCGQTPQLLVLLEELEEPYELVFRADGYFFSTYARPGPRLVDGELILFELTSMLRHCARTRAGGRLLQGSAHELARIDSWLELAGFLGLTAYSLRREEREEGDARRPRRIEEERSKISSIFQIVERTLDDSDGDWILGDFGLADCALIGLPRFAHLLDFAAWPRLRAYSERLLARPAVRRVVTLARSAPIFSTGASSCTIG